MLHSMHAALPEECRERIDQIRTISSTRNGLTAHGDWFISILESWLLDEEQLTVLGGNPLNGFYLQAAAYLKPETNIREDWTTLGIPDLWQARLIAEIVDLSSLSPNKWGSPRAVEDKDQLAAVPVELLAAALSLAERLDLHHPDTLKRIGRKSSALSLSSDHNWTNWFGTDSIGPHPYQTNTVLVRIHCCNSEVHRALKHYETDLDRFLAQLNKRIRPRFLFSKVSFEIRAEGYEPMDLRFRVDGSAALQLFMGNTLYGDKRVFLRELVQNALDACQLRKLLEPEYVPAITVSLDSKAQTLTVEDNGIGMDRKRLEKYFLNIGISFYRSAEIENQSDGTGLHLDFISNFGIGFLSTFLVADRIRVRSRKPDAEGLQITISDIEEYFDVRRNETALPIGTEVSVILKSERTKAWLDMEYLGYLKSVARFVSIPIEFTDSSGKTRLIGCEPLDSAGFAPSGRTFSASLPIAPSQGYLQVRTRGTDDRTYGLNKASGGMSIFQDGIFVTQIEQLLPPKARGYVVGRINLLGRHRCELSMDRNRIFWPQDQLRFFRQAVLQGIARATARMLQEMEQQSAAREVRRQMEHTVTSFFDVSTTDDSLFKILHPEIQKLLRQSFRSLLRTSLSKADSPGRDVSDLAAEHGFQYQWQKDVAAAMVQ
ncbi:MAG: ATP-binding protein [Desulfohalobiaceae bacterium]|nr:ATP-binding protein [Desulfohalobiaceae bacterium]